MLAKTLPTQCAAGKLSVRMPNGQDIICVSSQPGPTACVDVIRWRGLRRMLMGGNTGFAQAFIDGDCECDDLKSLFAWALVNDSMLERFGSGSTILRWAGTLYHRRHSNTLSGSRRNIAAHYDLGNDFYRAWLDEGMSYSSAIYGPDAGQTLEVAQEAKLDRILELMDVRGGERVLEIGCGWGALAERLVKSPAEHLTALTLSQRQLEFTRERLRSISPSFMKRFFVSREKSRRSRPEITL